MICHDCAHEFVDGEQINTIWYSGNPPGLEIGKTITICAWCVVDRRNPRFFH